MEGSRPAPHVRSSLVGFPPAGPALSITLAALGLLTVTLAALSTSSYNDAYQLMSWPPSAFAWESFFAGPGPALYANSLWLTTLALGFATVPAATTGYFFARKASDGVRRAGLFLLLGAWILSPMVVLGYARFALVGDLRGWAPWFLVPPSWFPAIALAIGATPPMTLAVYSSLREDFLGLPWPVSEGPRVARFEREAIPRGFAGLVFGGFFAGTWVLLDFFTVSVYGFTGTLSLYMVSLYSIIGGAPGAGVAAVVLFLTVFAGFATFLVLIYTIRRYVGPALWRAFPVTNSVHDRTLRISSGIVTSVGALVTLYALYLPLATSVLFSFNGMDGTTRFEGPLTFDWYTGSGSTRIGILSDPAYVASLRDSLAFAALAVAVATPFGLLASAVTPSLHARERFLLRATLYLGAAIPLTFFGPSMGFLRTVFVSPGAGALDLVWTGFLLLLVRLPLATAVTFIVASSAAGWQRPRPFGVARASWVVPFVAAPLAAFAVVIGVFSLDSLAQSTWVFFLLTKKIASPSIDAATTILVLTVYAPLAVAWVLLGRREPFHF